MLPEAISEILKQLAGNKQTKRHPVALALPLKRFIAKQNSNQIKIFPSEVEVLKAVAAEIDNERDVASAWRIINNPLESNSLRRPAEWDHIQDAVSENIHKATVSYLFNGSQQASGVLVEILGRDFIATTAHSVPQTISTGLLLTGYKSRSQRDVATIIGYGDGKFAGIDVAYLECEPGFVRESLGKNPVSLDRINPCGPGIAKRLAFVCGFPFEETRVVRTGRRSADRVLQATTYPFPPMMPKDWHVIRKQRAGKPPDKSIDAFIPFNINEPVQQHRSGKRIKLAHPGGTSGGGFWISVPKKKSVWSPESYKLFAIQSSFHEKGRYLRGIQIIHWLRLIWFHHPSLRKHIQTTFPRTQFDVP